CSYVYVDVLKGKAPVVPKHALKSGGGGEEAKSRKRPSIYTRDRESALINESLYTSNRREFWEHSFPHRKLQTYQEVKPLEEELGSAQRVFTDLHVCVSDMIKRLENKVSLEVKEIKEALNPMIESVVRNPDACIWLARMKNQDSYTYKHSMATSVWAVALGRQIGLPRVDLGTLAMGALMIDVGKLGLPQHILNKPERLTAEEFDIVKSHVELGVKMLKDGSDATRLVLEMVLTHHERFNGSGYPRKLKGNLIPIFGRIAAIADCYDAMISERTYANAISPSFAVRKLYEWRNIDFQAELVEEFIQAIGIYPAGTIVELSTGEIAIVVAENRERRLRPKVLVMLDAKKKPLKEQLLINLRDTHETENGDPLDIVASLEPGAYGISAEMVYL
ncbi:MAG TPA: HD-GYP domain-containing protein, partial [Pseudomonadales bacterium]|nr:HD-GYP domain-containing protein [Pseudomonadales bacterium]